MSTQTFYHLQNIELDLRQLYPWFDMDFIGTKCFLSYLAFMIVIGKHYKMYSDPDLLEVINNYRGKFFSNE